MLGISDRVVINPVTILQTNWQQKFCYMLFLVERRCDCSVLYCVSALLAGVSCIPLERLPDTICKCNMRTMLSQKSHRTVDNENRQLSQLCFLYVSCCVSRQSIHNLWNYPVKSLEYTEHSVYDCPSQEVNHKPRQWAANDKTVPVLHVGPLDLLVSRPAGSNDQAAAWCRRRQLMQPTDAANWCSQVMQLLSQPLMLSTLRQQASRPLSCCMHISVAPTQ